LNQNGIPKGIFTLIWEATVIVYENKHGAWPLTVCVRVVFCKISYIIRNIILNGVSFPDATFQMASLGKCLSTSERGGRKKAANP
jgi:hypothetical protein